MTKIFSAVFFAICLIGTWALVQNRPAVTYETHTDMQATVANLIGAHLAETKPNSRAFRMISVKSQVLSENTVRVDFHYEYEEPDINEAWVKYERAGSAELMRAASQEAGAPQAWQLRQGLGVSKEVIVLEDAQRVDPSIPENGEPADVPTGAAAAAPTGVTAPTGTPAPTPTPAANANPGEAPVGNSVDQ